MINNISTNPVRNQSLAQSSNVAQSSISSSSNTSSSSSSSNNNINKINTNSDNTSSSNTNRINNSNSSNQLISSSSNNVSIQKPLHSLTSSSPQALLPNKSFPKPGSNLVSTTKSIPIPNNNKLIASTPRKSPTPPLQSNIRSLQHQVQPLHRHAIAPAPVLSRVPIAAKPTQPPSQKSCTQQLQQHHQHHNIQQSQFLSTLPKSCYSSLSSSPSPSSVSLSKPPPAPPPTSRTAFVPTISTSKKWVLPPRPKPGRKPCNSSNQGSNRKKPSKRSTIKDKKLTTNPSCAKNDSSNTKLKQKSKSTSPLSLSCDEKQIPIKKETKPKPKVGNHSNVAHSSPLKINKVVIKTEEISPENLPLSTDTLAPPSAFMSSSSPSSFSALDIGSLDLTSTHCGLSSSLDTLDIRDPAHLENSTFDTTTIHPQISLDSSDSKISPNTMALHNNGATHISGVTDNLVSQNDLDSMMSLSIGFQDLTALEAMTVDIEPAQSRTEKVNIKLEEEEEEEEDKDQSDFGYSGLRAQKRSQSHPIYSTSDHGSSSFLGFQSLSDTKKDISKNSKSKKCSSGIKISQDDTQISVVSPSMLLLHEVSLNNSSNSPSAQPLDTFQNVPLTLESKLNGLDSLHDLNDSMILNTVVLGELDTISEIPEFGQMLVAPQPCDLDSIEINLLETKHTKGASQDVPAFTTTAAPSELIFSPTSTTLSTCPSPHISLNASSSLNNQSSSTSSDKRKHLNEDTNISGHSCFQIKQLKKALNDATAENKSLLKVINDLKKELVELKDEKKVIKPPTPTQQPSQYFESPAITKPKDKLILPINNSANKVTKCNKPKQKICGIASMTDGLTELLLESKQIPDLGSLLEPTSVSPYSATSPVANNVSFDKDQTTPVKNDGPEATKPETTHSVSPIDITPRTRRKQQELKAVSDSMLRVLSALDKKGIALNGSVQQNDIPTFGNDDQGIDKSKDSVSSLASLPISNSVIEDSVITDHPSEKQDSDILKSSVARPKSRNKPDVLDNCVGVCKPESISGASTSFDSVIGSIDNQPTPTDLNNEPTSEYEEGNKLAIGSDPKSTEGSRTSSVLDSEDLGLIEGILSNFYEDDEDKKEQHTDTVDSIHEETVDSEELAPTDESHSTGTTFLDGLKRGINTLQRNIAKTFSSTPTQTSSPESINLVSTSAATTPNEQFSRCVSVDNANKVSLAAAAAVVANRTTCDHQQLCRPKRHSIHCISLSPISLPKEVGTKSVNQVEPETVDDTSVCFPKRCSSTVSLRSSLCVGTSITPHKQLKKTDGDCITHADEIQNCKNSDSSNCGVLNSATPVVTIPSIPCPVIKQDPSLQYLSSSSSSLSSVLSSASVSTSNTVNSISALSSVKESSKSVEDNDGDVDNQEVDNEDVGETDKSKSTTPPARQKSLVSISDIGDIAGIEPKSSPHPVCELNMLVLQNLALAAGTNSKA